MLMKNHVFLDKPTMCLSLKNQGVTEEELGHIVQFKIQVFLPHATNGTSFNTHHIKTLCSSVK